MKRLQVDAGIMLGIMLLLTGCAVENPEQTAAEKPSGAEKVYEEEISAKEPEPEEGSKAGELAEEFPVRKSDSDAVLFGPTTLLHPKKGAFEFYFAPGHEGETWYYDEFFRLEQYAAGAWQELPMSGGFCGNTNYEEITSKLPNVLEIDWSPLYGSLEPGIYSLTKEVFPQKGDGPDTEAGVLVHAVFEMKDELGLSLLVWEEKPAGLRMEFVLYGGEETEEAEKLALEYGSWYRVDRLEDGSWIPVEYVRPEEEIAWTAEAYVITEDDPHQMEVDWEWLYGELPPGQYRFCKEVMAFREPGDYDTYLYAAEFVLEEEERDTTAELSELGKLYLQVLNDLWEKDGGLNSGVTYVSVDLSGAPGGLIEAEQRAVIEAFAGAHQVEGLALSYEELAEQGYLSEAEGVSLPEGKPALYEWRDGILFSIIAAEPEVTEESTIRFDAGKWRSPLGAYYFSGCEAVWTEGEGWQDYSVEGEMIS